MDHITKDHEKADGRELPKHKSKKETYNTQNSLVVTDPTTTWAVRGLTRGERTGSRIFHGLWSYVGECAVALLLYLVDRIIAFEPLLNSQYRFSLPLAKKALQPFLSGLVLCKKAAEGHSRSNFDLCSCASFISVARPLLQASSSVLHRVAGPSCDDLG